MVLFQNQKNFRKFYFNNSLRLMEFDKKSTWDYTYNFSIASTHGYVLLKYYYFIHVMVKSIDNIFINL